MDQDPQTEFRPANDTRQRTPVQQRKVETVEKKPSLTQRWRDAQPSKTVLFWSCLVSVILTMVIGFNWGGWVTAASAQKAGESMAKDAVIQRLVPICVEQFNQDPDKVAKLGELTGMTSSQRTRFVQDQGWATISGDEKPDRNVTNACAKLLLEMSP